MSDIAGALDAMNTRDQVIVRTSVVGIVANALLAAFKAAIGLITNSIAITLDAVNNLSDALSSVITIVGTKLAGKPADREHPYGYGRIEYLTAIIIAVIVLWAGITSLRESVGAIIHPEAAEYTAVALVIIAVAVMVKVVLGRYVKSVGKRVSSDSLVASGTDAVMDAAISASTLVAAGIYLLWGLSLEAWLGAAISLVIVKAGIDMLRETLSEILGARVDGGLSRQVKEAAAGVDGVYGAYDLSLSDYGPDRLRGSVHIEVPDMLTARDIDKVTREVQMRVFAQTGVMLDTVGIYSTNDGDEGLLRLRRTVEEIVAAHPEVVEMHGFYVDEEAGTLRFDVVVSFGADGSALRSELCAEVAAAIPEYDVHIVLDADVSD